ncbi:MAG: hypothetical protein ABIK89_10130 [Planctomycetota bacterium]
MSGSDLVEEFRFLLIVPCGGFEQPLPVLRALNETELFQLGESRGKRLNGSIAIIGILIALLLPADSSRIWPDLQV